MSRSLTSRLFFPVAPDEVGYTVANVFYVLGFACSTVVAWVLRTEGGDRLASISALEECETGPDGTELRCFRKEAVLRVACGSILFVAMQLLLVLSAVCCGGTRSVCLAHGALWPVRMGFWLGFVVVGVFAAPWGMIKGFFWLAAVCAVIFLCCQLVLLMAFTFKVWEWLRDKLTRGKSFVVVAMALSVLAVLGGAAIMVYLYVSYAPSASCSRNIAFITFTWLAWLGLLALTTWAVFISQGGPCPTNYLTVACLFPYLSWLCFTALTSAPPDRCTPRSAEDSEWKTVAWPGFVVGLLWLIYGGCSAPLRYRSFVGGHADGSSKHAEAATIFFHFLLLCASGLMAMSLSNWTLSGTAGRFELDQGTTSMWMKMASQWLCVALYTAACATSIRASRDAEFSIFSRPGLW